MGWLGRSVSRRLTAHRWAEPKIAAFGWFERALESFHWVLELCHQLMLLSAASSTISVRESASSRAEL